MYDINKVMEKHCIYTHGPQRETHLYIRRLGLMGLSIPFTLGYVKVNPFETLAFVRFLLLLLL